MLLWVHINNRRVLLIDFGNKTTIGHSSMSSTWKTGSTAKEYTRNTKTSYKPEKSVTSAPPLGKTLSCSTAALSKPHYYYLFWQFCSLGSLCFSCIVAFVCTLTIVGPKGYSSVCRRRQEGKILRVPSALNNFVLVLPYNHQRKLLCQVPCGRGTEIITHFMNPYPSPWVEGLF